MAGLAALAVLLVAHDAVAPAARELRVAIAGTAVLVAVTAAAPVAASLVLGVQGPIPGAGTAPTGVVATGAPTEAAAVVGLLALAVARVVAVRLGVIPFHLRVPRLADVVSPISLPLLLAWIPVPLGRGRDRDLRPADRAAGAAARRRADDHRASSRW